jgi:putative Holliday junction resolvase
VRYLGLDVGHKRVGVALSDALGMIAQPLGVLDPKHTNQLRDWANVYNITDIVVGLPKNRFGQPTQQTEWIEAWVKKTTPILTVNWHYWNEAYSTKAAEYVLLSANVKRQKRKQFKDQQAAVFILQGYLDYMNNQQKQVKV